MATVVSAYPRPDLWSPARVVVNPESGEQTLELADWPTDDPHEKYISRPIARQLVCVDEESFSQVQPSQTAQHCYELGSVGRRGTDVTGGPHPCEDPTCKICAIQFAAKTLGHLYTLFAHRTKVYVYEMPRLAYGPSFTAQVRRRKDVENASERGNYFALFRFDDSGHRVFVYSSACNGKRYQRLVTVMSSADALTHAMYEALRQPNVPPPGSRRFAASKEWRPPEVPRRDQTYGKGLKEHEIDAIKNQIEYQAFDAYDTDPSNLSPADLDDIGFKAARSVLGRPPWPS